MKIKKVTLMGTGHLNGPVKIHKVVEMEEQMASRFMGGNRHEVILAFLNVHYPGVKINPKNIGVNVVTVKADDKPKKKRNKQKRDKTKKMNSSSIGNSIANTFFSESETDSEKSERLRNERYIDDLNQSVKEKLEYLDRLNIPSNSDGLFDMLDDLIYKLNYNKWKSIVGSDDEDESKLINKLMDAYLAKYSTGVDKLKKIGISDSVLNDYILELKGLKRRKFLGNFSYILIMIGFLALLGVLSLIYD